MREIWTTLKTWIENDKSFALATVVRASRPAPRGVGAVMAIAADGSTFIGSVSAGCVENAVIQAAQETCKDGQTRWESYGGEAGFPWEIGLTCGGRITVRVDRIEPVKDNPALQSLIRIMEDEEEGLWIAGKGKSAFLSPEQDWTEDDTWNQETITKAKSFWEKDEALGEEKSSDGELLFYRIPTPARLFIVGAGHASIHLIPIARSLLYHTVVIDPREAYMNPERFPEKPDALICDWPSRTLGNFKISSRDSAVFLSHDPKIDDEALTYVLRTDCGYLGALGSKRSHSARCKRLKALGFKDSDLDRIEAPVGVAIDSKTPSEIAVSIAAGLIRYRNAR